MKNCMIISMLMIVVVILSSCGAADNNDKGVVIADINGGYQIEMLDGEYYLVFKDKKYQNSVNTSQTEPYLTFSSVAEMKDKVLGGKLTENEMYIMSQFSKDDTGKIKICNFEKIYEPVFPSDVTWDHRVDWDGDTYRPTIIESDSFSDITFVVHTQEGYNVSLKRAIDLIHSNDLVTITQTDTTDDRNATIYQYTTRAGEYKTIEYTIETKNGKLFVQEYYEINTKKSTLQVLDGVPHRIVLHGDFGDCYFYCSIHGLTERPSVEWLSSFGLDEVK